MTDAPPFLPHEYQEGANSWVGRTTRELGMLQHPILSEFRRETYDDLPYVPQEPRERQKTVLPDPRLNPAIRYDPTTAPEDDPMASPLFRPMESSHAFTVTFAEALAFDVERLLTTIYELSDELAGQLVASIFEHLSDVCETADQVVDATGRNNVDALLDAIEQTQLSFDEDGNHNMALILHPDTAQKLAASPPTPEKEARAAQIYARKKEEWDASRRRRDLP